MTRKIGTVAGPILAIVVGTSVCFGQESTEKKVREKVDSAVQSIKKGAREASDAIQAQYAKARTSIHNFGVSSRVYGRLHWDKTLSGSKIEIDVLQDGVATLTGSVADAKARAKAVELTRDTVGVTSVVDKLTVPASAAAAAAAPKP